MCKVNARWLSREALRLSPGNLRHHLNVMQRHGLIEERYVIDRKPRKLITLTLEGQGS